jgi:hypothetical protein
MTVQSLMEIAMLEALFFSSPSLFSREPFQKTHFPLSVTQAEKSACLPFLSIFFFSLAGRKSRESRTVRDFSFATEQRAVAHCFSAHLGWSPHSRDHSTTYNTYIGWDLCSGSHPM